MSKSKSFFEVGQVITLAGMEEFPEIEDVIKDEIAFESTPSQDALWIGRVGVKNFLRPPKFNGRYTGIELAVMGDPIGEYLAAGHEKKKFAEGIAHRLDPRRASEALIELALQRAIGFDFSATASSSSNREVDTFSTKIWYMPGNSLLPGRNRSKASPVNCMIQQPEWNHEKFIYLHDVSTKIAFKVLRDQLKRPISSPMRD